MNAFIKETNLMIRDINRKKKQTKTIESRKQRDVQKEITRVIYSLEKP